MEGGKKNIMEAWSHRKEEGERLDGGIRKMREDGVKDIEK